MGLFCYHLKLTTPRRDERGEYQRCLDCGGRLPWAWPDAAKSHAKGMHTGKIEASCSRSPNRFWQLLRKSA